MMIKSLVNIFSKFKRTTEIPMRNRKCKEQE